MIFSGVFPIAFFPKVFGDGKADFIGNFKKLDTYGTQQFVCFVALEVFERLLKLSPCFMNKITETTSG